MRAESLGRIFLRNSAVGLVGWAVILVSGLFFRYVPWTNGLAAGAGVFCVCSVLGTLKERRRGRRAVRANAVAGDRSAGKAGRTAPGGKSRA